MDFEFIETPVFTSVIEKLITDIEYEKLQTALINNPALGTLIPQAHGLRKLRWSLENKGKRGGIRVLYYLYLSKNQIYMIYAFAKSKQEDLSRKQLSELADYIRHQLKK